MLQAPPSRTEVLRYDIPWAVAVQKYSALSVLLASEQNSVSPFGVTAKLCQSVWCQSKTLSVLLVSEENSVSLFGVRGKLFPLMGT